MEVWKELIYQGKDYGEKLYVSTYGNIKNIITKTIYKTCCNKRTGYICVCISLGSRKDKKIFKLHKAVAETFLDNPDNLPEVNHKDGNKLNNSVDNLEWCTPSYNIQHAYDNKLKIALKHEKHSQSKLTTEEIIYIRQNYIPKNKEFGSRALAKKFSISHTQILKIVKNKNWIF